MLSNANIVISVPLSHTNLLLFAPGSINPSRDKELFLIKLIHLITS